MAPALLVAWLFQTLTSLSDLTAILATVSRRWFTKRRAASLEGSPVYWHLQGPGGSWAVSQLIPQQRQGQRPPAPLYVAIASGTARVPLHRSPGSSESVGPGPGCQCVLKSTPSQVILTCTRDETHGSAVCSSQTRQRKPREVKSLA